MVYRTQYFSAFSAVYAEIMQSYFCSAFFFFLQKDLDRQLFSYACVLFYC